jgi:putative transposase
VTILREPCRGARRTSTVVLVGREGRINLAGGLYHVGAEGNDGRAIVVDWSDCARWTSQLETAQRRFGWIAHAYCLMTTHFHLLVETPDPNLSDGMHWLNHVYAKTFNRRHGRRNHLFGKRFWDDLILSDEQLVAVTRYIALNPVKAGLCKRPQDWPWSNYGTLYPVAMGHASSAPTSIRAVVAQGARLAAQAAAAA